MCLQWTKKVVSVVSCCFILCTNSLSAEGALDLNVSNTVPASSFPLLSIKQKVWGKGVTSDENKLNIEAGETLQFKIEVSNAGDLPAHDVLLLTHLPKGLNYVPNTLSMNGDLPAAPLCATSHERTLGFHGITIPSTEEEPTVLCFEVKVNDTLPSRLSRLSSSTQAVYLGDPVLANAAFGDETSVTSIPVVMKVTNHKASQDIPYALLDITQEALVPSQAQAMKRAYVSPGDVVSFIMKITNSGNKATSIHWNTTLPDGMSYIEDSTRVDGDPLPETLYIAAKGEVGDTITLSFKAKVENSIPETVTRLRSYSFLSYNPDVKGSAATSNSVILFLRK